MNKTSQDYDLGGKRHHKSSLSSLAGFELGTAQPQLVFFFFKKITLKRSLELSNLDNVMELKTPICPQHFMVRKWPNLENFRSLKLSDLDFFRTTKA